MARVEREAHADPPVDGQAERDLALAQGPERRSELGLRQGAEAEPRAEGRVPRDVAKSRERGAAPAARAPGRRRPARAPTRARAARGRDGGRSPRGRLARVRHRQRESDWRTAAERHHEEPRLALRERELVQRARVVEERPFDPGARELPRGRPLDRRQRGPLVRAREADFVRERHPSRLAAERAGTAGTAGRQDATSASASRSATAAAARASPVLATGPGCSRSAPTVASAAASA